MKKDGVAHFFRIYAFLQEFGMRLDYNSTSTVVGVVQVSTERRTPCFRRSFPHWERKKKNV